MIHRPRVLRRLGWRRHFCFACDRFTWREHRAHQAFVGRGGTEWDVPEPVVVPAETPIVTAQPDVTRRDRWEFDSQVVGRELVRLYDEAIELGDVHEARHLVAALKAGNSEDCDGGRACSLDPPKFRLPDRPLEAHEDVHSVVPR